MAGQGLNLGLLDANILANVVCKTMQEGSFIGDWSKLMEYESLAKRNNYLMQSNIEFLKLAYGFRSNPLSLLRNFGVDLINSSPLKRGFMSVADGDWYEETRRLYLNS